MAVSEHDSYHIERQFSPSEWVLVVEKMTYAAAESALFKQRADEPNERFRLLQVKKYILEV